MMGALVELDGLRVASYAREHELSTDDALPRLLHETAAAAERAGRDTVEAGKQKLLRAHANVDRDRPATVIAGACFTGDRERANLVFRRWNEALAERATVLRTYLQGGTGILGEWIDEEFQKEADEAWTAALHPWWTRVLLATSFAFFGLLVGAPLASPDASWPVLLAVLVGALVGLALAQYGIRVARRTMAASEDRADR